MLSSVVSAITLGLFGHLSSASKPSFPQWDDAVCSLQTTHGLQGGSHREPLKSLRLRGESPDGGAEHAPERSEAACTGMAEVQSYTLSYAQHAVTGGMRYTYTLTPSPTPSPPPPGSVKGISNIEFEFDGCTCDSPNQFSDLELLEEPHTARRKRNATELSFVEECDNTDMILKFDEIGDQKGSVYTLSYTVADDNLDTADVSMNLKAGPTTFSVQICGPVCLPPTPKPTETPTPSPTGDTATSFGDPHVGNVKGERFDILQPDYHTFLVIPRGVDREDAQLHVLAKVDPLGPLCGGLLYVTELKFSGLWLGEVGSLEFSTNVSAAEMDAEKAMLIRVGSGSSSPSPPPGRLLSVSEFKATANRTVVPQVSTFRPKEPQSLNQHVDTLLVKLKLGPTIAKVRMVYQREKTGFSNSLWLTTTGLKYAQDEIGGILGSDSHDAAASAPQCEEGQDDGKRVSIRNRYAHTIHAVAALEDMD